MRYCTNCGHQLKAGQQFCTNCGAKQPDDSATPVNEQTTSVQAPQATSEQPDANPSNSNGGLQPLILVLGVILVIALGVGGYRGYNTYKRNHLTQQEIADIGADVANKYLGKGNVSVYYDKSENELYMEAKSGTGLYDRAEDSISSYGDIDSLSPYVGRFKKISKTMSPLMPTDLKDVRVEFMNPENTSRYLYITENGQVNYDFTVDDD